MLNDAKQMVAKIMPRQKTRRCTTSTPINTATARGMMEISNPKTNEAKTSPRRRAQTSTGEDTSRSSVLERASQGRIAGPTAVEVKKMAMPMSPGKSSFTVIFRPMVNAISRNKGNIRPKTMTGPLA